MLIQRRSFLRGLLGAPIIVAAHNIMPVRLLIPSLVGPDEAIVTAVVSPSGLLTINMITREAVRMWKDSNLFLTRLEDQHGGVFTLHGAQGLKLGDKILLSKGSTGPLETRPIRSVLRRMG